MKMIFKQILFKNRELIVKSSVPNTKYEHYKAKLLKLAECRSRFTVKLRDILYMRQTSCAEPMMTSHKIH